MSWLTIKGAAEWAAVSERTIHSWMTEGMRYRRRSTGMVRIKPEWVDEFIEQWEGQYDLDQQVNQVWEEMR
jgi:hypothetical protein